MTNQLLSRYRLLCREGADQASRIEQGQAHAPLTGLFQKLAQAPETNSFTAVLLGITPEARTAALQWLYGPEYGVVSVTVVEKLGLLEILLSERGFVLQQGSGKRELFEQLDSFIEALRHPDKLTHPSLSNWMDPIRLEVSSQSGIKGVTLLLPEKPALLLEHPALLSRLSTRANLLLVAAPLQHQLSATDHQAIQVLASSMDAIWPLLQVDELAEETALPKHGWWEHYAQPAVQVPPKLLTTHVPARIAPLLTETQEIKRQGLFLTHQVRRLDTAFAALSDELEQRQRQVDTRIRKEERKARLAETESEDIYARRKDWMDLRQEPQELISVISKALAERGRRNRSASGEVGKMLEQFLGSLSDKDLTREQGHSVIKLGVSEDFVRHLLSVTGSGLKKEFDRDVAHVAQEFEQARSTLGHRAAGLVGEPVRLAALELDGEQIWNRFRDGLNVRLRYRGELPKRGFWDRLKEGRQGAMSFLMMISILGIMFGAQTLRSHPLIGVILFFIFTGTIIYTVVRWRRDEEERLDKELDRLRDGVMSEVQRLVNDLQRELHGKVTDLLEQTGKSWTKEIEALSDTHSRDRQRQMEQEKQSLRDRLRLLEQQKRDLESLKPGVTRARQQSQQLIEQSLDALRGA